MKLYRMFLKPAPQAPYTIKDVVSFCMNNNVLAYGWSGLFKNGINIENTSDLLEASKSIKGKPNKVLKQFLNLKQNDLVWIKDLYGIFYICRVLDVPKCNYIESLDISSTVSVELHKVGTSIPGTIFHRFYRKNSPTIERITDHQMVLYSQSIFNTMSTLYRYEIKENVQLDLWKLLNGFDLEELVLDYIQLKYDYYLSKNSVANRDNTANIECELFPRRVGGQYCSAVVQVKHSEQSEAFIEDYKKYLENGQKVFLLLGDREYSQNIDGIEYIRKDDLFCFLSKHKELFPQSIQRWFDISTLNKSEQKA